MESVVKYGTAIPVSEELLQDGVGGYLMMWMDRHLNWLFNASRFQESMVPAMDIIEGVDHTWDDVYVEEIIEFSPGERRVAR